ncbi:MAG: metallophosphoesterase [Bacteroidales bacterium]
MKKLRICFFIIFLSFSMISCHNINSKDKNEIIKTNSSIDGPYIFHQKGEIINYYYRDKKLIKKTVKVGDSIDVIVPFRTPSKFKFKLINKYAPVSTSTTTKNNIFVTCDIEGNYFALVKLLIGNKVIDNNLNWIYGKNHLVFIGDMVDRGIRVTQELWLIYKLDKQAQEAGGQVHYILGNHDIMCMNGDNRYTDEKYKEVAKKLNISCKDLLSENSELGRWMQTKNCIERINNFTFVHAGISLKVCDLKLSYSEMNSKMRPFYRIQHTRKSSDKNISTLFGSYGILWYRGFVTSHKDKYSKISANEFDKVCKFYHTDKIFIGHSIVDTISSDFNNKLIRVDVHQPSYYSQSNNFFQAVLIKGNQIYRVDELGNKTIIQ